MNELQLKELSDLLEKFSRRYPDRSPENIKKTLEEALTALSEAKPLTAQDAAEKIAVCYSIQADSRILCLLILLFL